MSAVATVESICTCGSIGRADLRQCPEHFHIFRGDKRLTSVGRVVGLWPQEPCTSCGWPIYSAHLPNCFVKRKIDDANERGKQADALLSAYVIGKLQRIPAGTVRRDAVALFEKARRWFDKQGFRNVESQVLLADDEIGGLCDLRLDGMIVDLKAVYELRPHYAVQIGGYCALDGTSPDRAAILHVTERFPEARLIELKPYEIANDWQTLREAWNMIQRRNS